MNDGPRFLLLSQDAEAMGRLQEFADKFGCSLTTESMVKPLTSNTAQEIVAPGFDVVFIDESFGSYHHCLTILGAIRYVCNHDAVPVFALVQDGNSNRLLELYKAGASCCLVKPIAHRALEEVLDMMFTDEQPQA